MIAHNVPRIGAAPYTPDFIAGAKALSCKAVRVRF